MKVISLVIVLLIAACSKSAMANTDQSEQGNASGAPAASSVKHDATRTTIASRAWQQTPETVTRLPLRLGYYAVGKGSCGLEHQGDSLVELKDTGFVDEMENFARFKKIVRVSPVHFMVTQEWTAEDGISTDEENANYKVVSDRSFAIEQSQTESDPEVFTWCPPDQVPDYVKQED